MRCSSCNTDNPQGMNFCGNCAAPLKGRCAQCGFDNPPSFKFCGECAAPLTDSVTAAPVSMKKPASAQREPRAYTPKHLADKILQSKSALEGERKQITVLFADVKGSMEMAEQMDAEEGSRIMNRFFQI